MELFLRGGSIWKGSNVPGRIGVADRSRRVARPAPFYRFFLVRRFFVVVGTIEKVDELRRAGNIGAGLTVVLTLTFPDGVKVVFVRMRMVPPNVGRFRTVSLPDAGRFEAVILISMSGAYSLPRELSRHASRGLFAPDELREVCREAVEGLGKEDAREACFRLAAEMVEMWRGLDLPAWVAPYVLRDARLGYLAGYGEALVSGEMAEGWVRAAAEARWGGDWREKLASVRERSAKS